MNKFKSSYSKIKTQFIIASRSFRHRNYLIYFTAQIIGQNSRWMQSISLWWLVYDITKSSYLLGLASFCTLFSAVIISPFGGLIADKYPRKTILLFTQSAAMFSSILLAIISFSGNIELWQILVIGIFSGFIFGIDMPTRQAMMSELVPPEDLVNTIAINSTVFHSARMIGPSIAGLLISIVGVTFCFFLNAVSFLFIIIIFSRIKLQKVVKVSNSIKLSIFQEIKLGFKYSLSKFAYRVIFFNTFMFVSFSIAYSVYIPVYSMEVFKSDSKMIGFLMAVSALGSVFGGLRLTFRKNYNDIENKITTASIICGICAIAFAFSDIFWLSIIILFIEGFFMIQVLSPSNALLQSMLPLSYRGRVLSFYFLIVTISAAFNSLFAGYLIHLLDPHISLIITGSMCIFGGLIFFIQRKKFNSERTELIHQANTPVL